MKTKLINRLLNGSLIVLIIVLIISLTVVTNKKDDKSVSAAEEANLLVANSGNITIYVSGNHVNNLKSSQYLTFGEHSHFYSEYSVEANATITISAVSENKLFTNWLIFDSDKPNIDLSDTILPNPGDGTPRNTKERTSFKIPATVTGQLVVIAQYKETISASDYGLYFFDPFFIDDADDFESLARIVNNQSPTVDDYAAFNLTQTNANREKLIKGYFKITKSLTLKDSFVSIGTLENPFYGKIDGSNNGENAIISINQIYEIDEDGHSGDYYCGLFGAISEYNEYDVTLIRNIRMQGIISIIEDLETGYDNAYIGGFAGVSGHGVIVENCESKVDISVDTYDTNVYAGGFFGYSYNEIDQNRNLSVKAEHKNWSVSTNSTSTDKGDIYLGGYAGYLTNAYIYDFKVICDAFSSSASAMGYGDVYHGAIAGKICHTTSSISPKIVFEDVEHIHFTNANVICSDSISISGQSNIGNAYVGGLVGSINATDYAVTVANISIHADVNHQSFIEADTRDQNSYGDVYLGGIFGYVDGKRAIYNENYITEHAPIFTGNILMKATQKGESDSSTGRAVGGVFVGHGYIDVDDNNIFLNSPDSKINLEVIQDKFSRNTEYKNDNTGPTCIYEHISAGIFSGSFGTASLLDISIDNFTLIANNVTVNGIREEGSKSLGQITVGGLTGFSYGLDVNNVKLLYNNCNLYINSLSYELRVTTEGNNAYLGGVIGKFSGDTEMAKMNNAVIAGYSFPSENKYDYDENNLSTAVSEINGLQNTQAGGGDYKGEIYVGGLIGCSIYAHVSYSEYRGTNTEKNKIYLRGNNNVDSAMLGGVIGLLRSQYYTDSTKISYCKVSNVHIQTEASCTTRENPDVYVGGTVGAVFIDGRTGQGPVNINNCVVNNSIVQGIGHQDMKTYVGGILGGSCWNLKTTVEHCISYNNRILSTVDQHVTGGLIAKAFAGGIAGFSEAGGNLNIDSCASINDFIEASVAFDGTNSSLAFAGGLFGRVNEELHNDKEILIENSYVNSTVEANSTATTRETKGILGCSVYTSTNKNYYNATNMNDDDFDETNSATPVTFKEITGIAINETDSLFDSAVLDTDSTIPYTFVKMSNPDIFTASSSGGVWSYSSGTTVGSSYADLWVKIIDNDSTEPSYANGWVRLGYTKLIMANATGYKLDTNYNTTYNPNDYEITESTVDEIVVNLNSKMDMLSFDVSVIDNSNSSLASNMEIYETFSIDSSIISNLGVFNFINNGDGTKTIKYYPAVEYMDDDVTEFDLTLTSGDGQKVIHFIINANTFEKMQARYSDTTLPLNYNGKNDGKVVGYFTYGNASDPYIYHDNTTIKIIPAFNRLNDGDVISDLSCQYVTYKAYTIDGTGTETAVTIKPSGELVVTSVSTYNRYRVEIELLSKYNLKSLGKSEVYITILPTIAISTELKGANYEGPFAVASHNATYPYNFVFNITPKSGFSGIPEQLSIKIGESNVYDLMAGVNIDKKEYSVNTTLEDLIIKRLDVSTNNIVKDENTTTFDWVSSDSGYQLIIPSNYITDEVKITAEFNPSYTILFDVNLDYEGINDTNRYLSVSGTSAYTISDLIGATRTQETVNGELKYKYSLNGSVLDRFNKLAPFGYTLHGWYLIDDASYVASYGRSLEELLANYANNNGGKELHLNGNYTFYARWSFSIFLNEAPGTTIKCSFPETFLHKDKYNVDVPINNKKGFSFTIVKSSTFAGEADVNAHILIKDSSDPLNDKYILRQVTVQKYHDDMYVYTVAPEDINGVLVLTTFSCDSDFIVGEKQESVDEDIVPEDGVFTIKYVVNHLENEETKRQSFAYADQNIILKKKLKLSFTKETSDLDNPIVPYVLPEGTEVKLYYILDEGDVSVGYYKLPTAKSSIYASDFNIINTNQKMFADQTFEEFFGMKKSSSEGYYFVITPPNGYSSGTIVGSDYLNCKAVIGYVNEDETEYLYADRYTFNDEDANKPPYYTEMRQAPSKLLEDQSKHESAFIVYNSRITKIDNIDSYDFQITDEYYSIDVDGTIHTNPGDWRHQNKYFSLGIQVYTNDTTKAPIDLSGLTIRVYKNNTFLSEETVNINLPKNAVYSLIDGSGIYYIEVLVDGDNEDIASSTSGFTSSTAYGLSITLVEATSNTKPAMGVIRGHIDKSIQTMNSVKLWSGISIPTHVASGETPELPSKNSLGDTITWDVQTDYNNTGSSDITGKVIGKINKDGVEYVKEFNIIILGNTTAIYNNFISQLTIEDYLINVNNINNGLINHNSRFKSEILIPNSSYKLRINSYSIDTTGTDQEDFDDRVVYGWLNQDDDTITVSYSLIKPSGEEVVFDSPIPSTKSYNEDKLGNALRIAEDPIVVTAINGIHNYVTSATPTGDANVIIAFETVDLSHSLDNVSWKQVSRINNYLFDNNGVLSIQNRPTSTTINKDVYGLLFTHPTTKKTYQYNVDIYVAPETITSTITNDPSRIGSETYSQEISFTIGDYTFSRNVSYTITVATTSVTTGGYFQQTYAWSYSGYYGYYSSSYQGLTLTFTVTSDDMSNIVIQESKLVISEQRSCTVSVSNNVISVVSNNNGNRRFKYTSFDITYNITLTKDSFAIS